MKTQGFLERAYHLLNERGIIKTTILGFMEMVENEKLTRIFVGGLSNCGQIKMREIPVLTWRLYRQIPRKKLLENSKDRLAFQGFETCTDHTTLLTFNHLRKYVVFFEAVKNIKP